MKTTVLIIGLGLSLLSCSKSTDNESMRSLLVDQLKSTHTDENWFAPTERALEDLNEEQSNWKPDTAAHSIKETVSHLIFWNERVLQGFKLDSVSDFEDDNDLTFKRLNDQDWAESLRKLDVVQSEWETVTANATGDQLKKWGREIASMSAHTAYHTGQIVYIRKLNGWWK